MKFVITFLFVLVLSAYLCSQEIPELISFAGEDFPGKSQSWMIDQDAEGRIYVANSSGILIYNGFSWEKIELPSQLITRSVFASADSTIYCGSHETFGFIDKPKVGELSYKAISDRLPTSELQEQEIWNILQDENEIVFQSFSSLYSYQEDSITQVTPPTNVMLGTKLDNQILIPSIESGIYHYSQDSFVLIAGSELMPGESRIAGITNTKVEGEWLIATQDNGMYLLNSTRYEAISSKINDKLKTHRLNKILRLQNGNYAIGTILNGVYLLNSNFDIIHHVNKSNGLYNNTVLSLYEDKNQNLWIGLDKGMNLWNLSDERLYYYDFSGQLGTIYCAAEFEGNLYLGTNQGLFRQDSKSKYALIEETQGQVWSLLPTAEGLLCGHNRGTYLVNEKKALKVSSITGGWDLRKIANNQFLQSTYTGLVKITSEKNGLRFDRIENSQFLIRSFQLVGHNLFGLHPQKGFIALELDSDFSRVISSEVFENDNAPADKLIHIHNRDEDILLQSNTKTYSFQDNKFEVLKNKDLSIPRSNAIPVRGAVEHTDYIYTFTNGYYLSESKLGDMVIPNEILSVDFIRTAESRYNHAVMEFNANERNLEIQLKSNIKGNSKIDYEYTVSDYLPAWEDLPKDGKINLLNVGKGDYVISLRATNNINSQYQLYSFRVKADWYESRLAYLLYSLIFLALIFLFFKYQKKKLLKAELKFQGEQKRKLEEQLIKARNHQLERELKYKSKMLANSAMVMIQKNNMLQELKIHLKKAREENDKAEFDKINHLIRRNLRSDEDWEIFEKNFSEVHDDFLKALEERHRDLTGSELRLAAYIKMNLSTKEIAPLLNISTRSVENKRYRLRKKLALEHNDSMTSYLMSF